MRQNLIDSNETNIATPVASSAQSSEHVSPVTLVPSVLDQNPGQIEVFKYALNQLISGDQQLRLAIIGGPGK